MNLMLHWTMKLRCFFFFFSLQLSGFGDPMPTVITGFRCREVAPAVFFFWSSSSALSFDMLCMLCLFHQQGILPTEPPLSRFVFLSFFSFTIITEFWSLLYVKIPADQVLLKYINSHATNGWISLNCQKLYINSNNHSSPNVVSGKRS